MRKNVRIIQIAGFKGILLVLIVAGCLVAGFGLFPAYLSMYIWNFISAKTQFLPQIGLFQGFLLWAAIAISLYISNERQKYFFSVTTKRQLTEDEVKKLLNRIKLQRAQLINNQIALKSGNLKTIEKQVIENENKEKENI